MFWFEVVGWKSSSSENTWQVVAGWILWSISDWGSDVELVEDMLKSNDWNLTCRFSWCVGVETVTLRTDHLTWRVGGYGFLFRSEFCFRTIHELEYLFILSRKARNLFPKFNIRLYDKNSESDYFFFPPPKSEYFFSNIGNQNIFLEKKQSPPSPPPPFKLNGRSLTENMFVKQKCAYIRNS